MRQNCFELVSAVKFLIFVLHDQLLAKNAHRSWIHSIQKFFLNIRKKLNEYLLF